MPRVTLTSVEERSSSAVAEHRSRCAVVEAVVSAEAAISAEAGSSSWPCWLEVDLGGTE